MAPRSKKSLKTKKNAQKRWSQDKIEISESRPNIQEPVIESIQIPTPSLRQEKLESRAENITCEDKEVCTYILIDTNQLSSLLKSVKCHECKVGNLNIKFTNESGFAAKMELKCCECDVGNSEYTSRRLVPVSKSKRPPFDVNQRMIQAFTVIGKGYAAAEQFCMVMNMNVISKVSFHDHLECFGNATIKTVDSLLNEARSEVRKAYADLNEDTITPAIQNIAVSYDGS